MEKDKLFKSLNMLAIMFSVLIIFACISLYKGWDNMSVGNSIAVSGESKVYANPDIAVITFNLDEVKPTSKEAQAIVSAKMDKVKSALSALKIEDKDIKTDNYAVYPKYTYQYCTTSYVPCSTKEKLEGYEVSHSVTVKVRDVDSASKVLDALGGVGVNNITGPNFTVDDIDAMKAEARGKAIVNAKAKAKVLADQLGVSLGDIISYSDDNNTYMTDMYRSAVPMVMKAEVGGMTNDISLPQGQNEIDAKVTITYKLK